MKIIKYYSIYILLLSSFYSFAMEHAELEKITVEIVIEDVMSEIDSKHLGLSKCEKFPLVKSVIGSYLSCYRGRYLIPQKAATEMEEIESYIAKKTQHTESINTMQVLRQLVAKHWYVYYLMSTLEDEKINELYDVTGSTIDELYDFVCKSDVKKLIHGDAWKTFIDDSKIHAQSLIDLVPRGLCDIHFTVLSEPNDNNIRSHSLAMSADSKYLIATNDKFQNITWDMKTGEVIDLQNSEKDIQWTRGGRGPILVAPFSSQQKYGVVDSGKNYYAVAMPANTIVHEAYFSSDVKKDHKKRIVLFKRPTEASCFCQVAFCNSMRSRVRLESLRDSDMVKNIEGFVQGNLIRITNQHIDKLTPQEDCKKNL